MTTGRSSEEAESTEQGETPEPHPSDEQRETGDEAAGIGAQVSDELEELVAELTRERDEYLALAQRAKADFDNYRKRAAREASDAERRGRAVLARELLPSIDDLERALSVADGGTDLTRGVELVHGQLQAALARAGVESYDPAGERFDPTVHEAISTRAADEVDPGTVIETLERGYRMNGQVLRPARVVVSE